VDFNAWVLTGKAGVGSQQSTAGGLKSILNSKSGALSCRSSNKGGTKSVTISNHKNSNDQNNATIIQMLFPFPASQKMYAFAYMFLMKRLRLSNATPISEITIGLIRSKGIF